MIIRLELQSNATIDEVAAERPFHGELVADVDTYTYEPIGAYIDYHNAGKTWSLPKNAAMAMVGGPERFRELVDAHVNGRTLTGRKAS